MNCLTFYNLDIFSQQCEIDDVVKDIILKKTKKLDSIGKMSTNFSLNIFACFCLFKFLDYLLTGTKLHFFVMLTYISIFFMIFNACQLLVFEFYLRNADNKKAIEKLVNYNIIIDAILVVTSLIWYIYSLIF